LGAGRGNNTTRREQIERRERICSRSVGSEWRQKEGERGQGDMIEEPEVEDVVSSQ